MSIDRAAGSASVNSGGTDELAATSVETVRILRFSIGVTLAVAIAFTIEWPLYFLTPVLAAAFLSGPIPGMSPHRWFLSLVYILAAMVLGTVFTLYLVPYPLIFIPALGLVLFRVYYLLNRRGPFMFVLMSLLAVLILPMLGIANEQLAFAFAGYFAFSASLSIVIFALAHWLFPDPPGPVVAAQPAFVPGYSAPAASAALKSTLAVLPLVVVFIAFGLHSELLVMVYAAMFSLIPDLSAGFAAGRKALTSTLIGCLAAVVVYWLLVAVPEFHFLVPLWLLAMLLFARAIFSPHPLQKYMGSAATAMIVLVSGSLGPDADFVDKVVTRVVLICLATMYVITAMAMLDRYVFRKSGTATTS